MKITFWTDGASRGNPGRGGWGVYAIVAGDSGEEKIFNFSGGEKLTTNNQMELKASIEALKFLNKIIKTYSLHKEKKPKSLTVTIFTDSKYVKNGVTEWIKNWEKNNWKNANRKPVLNKDLWQELVSLKYSINDKLIKDKFGEIKWEYVKGHFGIEGNEVADKLATEAADKLL
jgi:ribonuclease HI